MTVSAAHKKRKAGKDRGHSGLAKPAFPLHTALWKIQTPGWKETHMDIGLDAATAEVLQRQAVDRGLTLGSWIKELTLEHELDVSGAATSR